VCRTLVATRKNLTDLIEDDSMHAQEVNLKSRHEFIAAYLSRSAEVITHTGESCSESIAQAAHIITECFENNGKLMICGNGGSAAESQHMAAELTHRLSAAVEWRALPAIALTTDTSLLTECADDYGFESIFKRQIEALGRSGDVLLGISTSGSSANVVAAMRQARKQDLKTLALVGSSGEMVTLADCAICIPDADPQSIQEAQLVVIHILCAIVEQGIVIPQSDERAAVIDQVKRINPTESLA